MSGNRFNHKDIGKVLIIKTSSLGDIIHVLPCLKAVRGLFPSAQLTWLIQKEYAELLENNPDIDAVVVSERLSIRKLSSFKNMLGVVAKLRNEKFDLVIDLQWLIRTGIISFLSGAPLRFGLGNWKESSHLLYNRKIFVEHKNIHAVERNILFVKALGAEISRVEFPLNIDEISRDNVGKLTGGVKKYVVIAPSARWTTKRWPAKSFASLIGKITLPCIIAGSEGDRELAEEIISRAQGAGGRSQQTTVINLCGRTNLKELTALIDGAKAVVSNDSGPMHIAAALDKPVVALFGPTDPLKTGPYGWQNKKNMKVLKAGVPCSPCRKKKCRDLVCMKAIEADRVFDALREYL